MSTTTSNLSLIKPELQDEKHQTIQDLANNFQKLDDVSERYTSSPPTSGNHVVSQRIWNNQPSVGGFAGWICTRTGRAAPKWVGLTSYSIGSIIVPTADNGHVYECIQAGYSAVLEPSFPVSGGAEIQDTRGATTWIPNKSYNFQDVVFPTVDNGRFYVCTVAGDSGIFEPVWAASDGLTTTDGTVVWSSYRIARWREAGIATMYRPFGKIE